MDPETPVVRLDTRFSNENTRPRATLKERAKQLSVYLEPAVHEQLRELAYTERTKIHQLMLEAVDLLFKNRGALSIRQLTAQKGKPDGVS